MQCYRHIQRCLCRAYPHSLRPCCSRQKTSASYLRRTIVQTHHRHANSRQGDDVLPGADEAPPTQDFLGGSPGLTLRKVSEHVHQLTERPSMDVENSKRLRLLIEQALRSEDRAVKRFAALFVVKEALRSIPGGPRSAIAARARELVEKLAEDKDPEALILVARLYELAPLDHHLQSSLLKSGNLYNEAHGILIARRWPRGRAKEIVVDAADAWYAYGMFKVTQDSANTQAGIEALTCAAEKHGHFEACRELAARLPTSSKERYEMLLRLAVSGHLEAAKELGDLCKALAARANGDRPHESMDNKVEEDILWLDIPNLETTIFGSKIRRSVTSKLLKNHNNMDMEALYPPPYSTPSRWISYVDFKARLWYKQNMANGAEDTETKATAWIAGAKEDSRIIRERYMAHCKNQQVHDNGDMTGEAGTNHWRNSITQSAVFKMIDWYKFASIGGYGPAMFDGLVEAAKHELMYDVLWFHHHIYTLFPEVKTKWPLEYSGMRKKDHRAAELKAIIDGGELGGETPFDVERLMIYGSV